MHSKLFCSQYNVHHRYLDQVFLWYRVDSDLNVVVSDFGLSRDVFYSDYYRLTHKALLPVKWMAPEGLRDRIYNEKTDVVSLNIL